MSYMPPRGRVTHYSRQSAVRSSHKKRIAAAVFMKLLVSVLWSLEQSLLEPKLFYYKGSVSALCCFVCLCSASFSFTFGLWGMRLFGKLVANTLKKLILKSGPLGAVIVQSGDEWLQVQCSRQHVYCTFKKTTRNSSAWNLQRLFSSAPQTGICSSAGRLPGTQWGSEVCKKEAINYRLNIRNIKLNLTRCSSRHTVLLSLICWWLKVLRFGTWPWPAQVRGLGCSPHLSLASTERPCSRMGTTVWSRYALVGSACRSTFCFDIFSAPTFSFSTVLWGASPKHAASQPPLSHHRVQVCVCVCFTCRLSVSPYSAWGFSDTCRWVVWFQ